MIVEQEKVYNRFWSKVKKFEHTDCWLWWGAKSSAGYGRFKIDGVLYSPHRMVYEWHYGEIPDGYDVCHHCDNSSCVNPDHLFAATRSHNMIDAAVKGRLDPLRGEKNPNSKLRAVDIPRIRKLSERGRSNRSIARLFDVSPTTINKVVNFESWTHV